VAEDIHHPLFARFFDRLSRTMEKEAGPRREELLSGLSGRVVEIGAGNGINFRHYPATVEEVVAIEPEPYLRAKAVQAAASAGVPVRVRSGLADRIEFADGSFDAAVACLVLCTVPDLQAVLGELRRVVVPEGELRFFEHVRAGESPKARVQRGIDRSGVWPLIGGGCHCSRDTVAAIESAGFAIENSRKIDIGPAWGITNPHVLGTARLK
jgi:ubiquinone/menaquinone biosynthesis C-methylase UbiE